MTLGRAVMESAFAGVAVGLLLLAIDFFTELDVGSYALYAYAILGIAVAAYYVPKLQKARRRK